MKIIFVNFALVLACMSLLEIFLQVSTKPSPSNRVESKDLCYQYDDPKYGHRPRPNCKTTAERIYQGKSVYKVDYIYDAFGRRIATPKQSNLPKKTFLALLGDSNIFGEGLPGEETIAANLSRMNPDHAVYNYAVSGYGLNQQLSLAGSSRFKDEIREGTGYFFTFYLDHMEERLIGSIDYLSWGANAPYWSLQSSGLLEFKGRFEDALPLKTWVARTLLPSSKLLQSFRRILKLDFMETRGKNSQKYTCSSHKQIQKGIDIQKPGSKLVVVLPLVTRALPNYLSCLQDHIKVLDLRQHPDFLERSETQIAPNIDRHMNAKYASALALQISDWLKTQDK